MIKNLFYSLGSWLLAVLVSQPQISQPTALNGLHVAHVVLIQQMALPTNLSVICRLCRMGIVYAFFVFTINFSHNKKSTASILAKITNSEQIAFLLQYLVLRFGRGNFFNVMSIALWGLVSLLQRQPNFSEEFVGPEKNRWLLRCLAGEVARRAPVGRNVGCGVEAAESVDWLQCDRYWKRIRLPSAVARVERQ